MDENNLKDKHVRELVAKGTLALSQIAKDPREAINLVAQTVAGLVRGEGAATFATVFDNLSKRGEIDHKFPDSSKGRFFIQEINEVINNESRDEQALITKIKLFIAIASKTYSQHSEDEAKEVWKIVRQLSSIDIKVLATAYRLKLDNKSTRVQSEHEWNRRIAEESGLIYLEFIETATNSLKSKQLINANISSDHRITELGLCVAGYLHEGDRLFTISDQ